MKMESEKQETHIRENRTNTDPQQQHISARK